MAEAARDLGLHPSVLYRWVKGYGGDSHQAFPGHGQQGATQAEITSLRREVRKLKAERDILKKGRGLLCERHLIEVCVYSEASRDMAAEVDGARCSMSRRVVFTVGWCGRRVNGPGMMRCWYARFVVVFAGEW